MNWKFLKDVVVGFIWGMAFFFIGSWVLTITGGDVLLQKGFQSIPSFQGTFGETFDGPLRFVYIRGGHPTLVAAQKGGQGR